MEGSQYAFDPDESFEVSRDPATASEDVEWEGLNVSRVAVLATILGGDAHALSGLEEECFAFGFSEQLSVGEVNWGDFRWPEGGVPTTVGPEDGRAVWWAELNETARPEPALAFLVATLGSELERESAAAAAALYTHTTEVGPSRYPWWGWEFDRLYRLIDRLGLDWREPRPPGLPDPDAGALPFAWDPERWTTTFRETLLEPRRGVRFQLTAVRALSWARIRLAQRGIDPIARSLANAAFLRRGGDDIGESAAQLELPKTTSPGDLSTTIHGTYAFTGQWWRPPDEFFEYICTEHRPNLYRRGARFHWSGRYRDADRHSAATYFCDWVDDLAPNGVQTVLAHSYGGEVAARALLAGASVNQLVLLSTPVTHYVHAAASTGVPIVDVRLPFDPVLALARRPQRLRSYSNVTEVLLDSKRRLDHGASHSKAVWESENVASRGGL